MEYGKLGPRRCDTHPSVVGSTNASRRAEPKLSKFGVPAPKGLRSAHVDGTYETDPFGAKSMASEHKSPNDGLHRPEKDAQVIEQ